MIYVWKNVLILRILMDSLVYFAGKLIMNTKNSRIFLKIQNWFQACLLDQEKLFDKKTEIKSRDTIPLNLLSVNNYL